MKRIILFAIPAVLVGLVGVWTLVAADKQVSTREKSTTRLYIRTVPPGADIKIDGESRGSSDRLFQIPSDVKKVLVEVELDGSGGRKEVIIRGGEITRVEFDLKSGPEVEKPRVDAGTARDHLRAVVQRGLLEDLATLTKLSKTHGPSHREVVALKEEIRVAEQWLKDAATDRPTPSRQSTIDTLPAVVVETVPLSGDTKVDPSLTEIRVTFSKQMMDQSWSWSQLSDESFPTTTGKPRYLADGRTSVLPVTLKPGKAYAVWLNSAQFGNFKDAQGRPAVPYLLIFETHP